MAAAAVVAVVVVLVAAAAMVMVVIIIIVVIIIMVVMVLLRGATVRTFCSTSPLHTLVFLPDTVCACAFVVQARLLNVCVRVVRLSTINWFIIRIRAIYI